MASQRVKDEIAKAKAQHGGKRAGAGPKKGARISPATREKIRGAMIMKRMEDIALGRVAAHPHEVTAGLGILKFALPTLQATDITTQGDKVTIELVEFKR